VWTQQAQLIAADGARYDAFGHSVGIAGDTVVVGSYSHDVGINAGQGSTYLFTRTAGVWTPQAQLIAPDGAAHDVFGESVAIAGDAVVVGAAGHDVGGNVDRGAAYVFRRSAGVWALDEQLIAAPGTAREAFGRGVAIAGNTVVVGAPGSTISMQGWAYVFQGAGLPPIANAGADQLLIGCAGFVSVVLDGSGSTEPSGGPLQYVWRALIGAHPPFEGSYVVAASASPYSLAVLGFRDAHARTDRHQ
jgi:hypothetical protein